MTKLRKLIRPRLRDGLLWCPKCRQWLDLESFSRDKSDYNGYAAYCRQCQVGLDKEYQHQYYLTHRGRR